jgi:hypothetical protein
MKNREKAGRRGGTIVAIRLLDSECTGVVETAE